VKKLLVEVSGTVAGPADVVLERVVAMIAGYPGFEIDRERGTVATQGGWWYRGEYTVDSSQAGADGGPASVVTHRVYNVAEWMRWGVPLANRLFIGYREKVESGFDSMLKALAAPAAR
jgi:hypothetical protein